MKIGIDCRLWNETGVGRYIRNLILNLQELDRKNQYVLFVLGKDEENIKFSIFNSQFSIRITNINWHSIQEQLKFPQILNKENLDLVHFPYFSVPIFYNRPFVVTIHDLIMSHFSTGNASTLLFPIYNLKFLGYKFVIANAVKKAKKIIAVSNATKDEIINHLKVDSKKIAVTYEGVDKHLAVSSQKLLVKGKYFLYVGNAYPHKNLDRLLQAFSIFNSQFSTVNLVLVGKEDYFYKRLKRKVQDLNLSDKVIFLQNVSDEELSSLYKNALVLIMPSLMEGFGLPALEAMANKCLVLSSNIPSIQEICRDAAIYFDPYDIKDMVEKMNAIHDDNTYHRSDKVEKGSEQVKLFSWEKMANETLEVYESSVGV